MNDNNDAGARAIERFEKWSFEDTWCGVQDSFETFTLAVRNNVKVDLKHLIPEIESRTFKEINMIQLVVGFGALREGARAFASLNPKQMSPGSRQIDYDRLWREMSLMNDPRSQIHARLRTSLEHLPQMDDVLTYAGNTLLETLIQKSPMLASTESRLKQMMFVNLLYGVKMEYAFPLISKQVDEERRLMQRFLLLDRPDNDGDITVVARLKSQFGISDDHLPWPLDMRCCCGEDLRAQAVCCDPDRPLELNTDALTPDFLLEADCCGARLAGVRCSHCARYYSWANGTIETFS
jgi:hypothetical protein